MMHPEGGGRPGGQATRTLGRRTFRKVKRKHFFFEKKKQKTFVSLAPGLAAGATFW
jgi:hypothetical protein